MILEPTVVRHLAASIIYRAVLDLIYKDERSPYWHSARSFFASSWFEDLADYLGYDIESVRKAIDQICANREYYRNLLRSLS
ncbi:hypothetical protein SAMN00808754_1069 [Thermanaeromonas toyohensis ToBE]|uniref:Uncharacterized protein n=1 Tax=Thermanaeromonas toyohensis ToBE TaxID=698762 RepID=A0A1W1VMZ5_9FIRM|nr:hypothetical protein [Thermanaeromonas toyohensis]SMB94600.1 hypothetical protein SAMN00808754_1069 [Thermanaeromonas toyohensis ToBE]